MTDTRNTSAVEAQAGRLRTERDRFVALAFCWADLLLELDESRAVVFAGGATGPLLGRRPEDLVGLRLSEIAAAQDRVLAEQLLNIAERQGRIESAAVRLAGNFGPTPPLMFSGYRLDEFDRHFFLAFRVGVRPETKGPARTAGRDAETGLVDADSFAATAAAQLKDIQAAGADARVTLISMPGLSELRHRLDDVSQKTLMSTVGACFQAHSVSYGVAARLDEDSYSLVHEAGLDVDRFERELETVTREVDPEGKGVAVESATLDVDDTSVSEEDMAKSLLYVLNRYQESKGPNFTLKNLSKNFSTLMKEAADSVEGFKNLVTKADFDVAFQPIIDVASGEIHHYEALARFRDGADGSPYRHIAFAEQTGLITEFDIAMLRKVVRWLDQWPRNTSRYRVAVNISGVSVGTVTYEESLHDVLKIHAWAQDRLLFEITESSRVSDLEAANDFIQGVRRKGHHVCLDDFGAGAASFQYLSALEVDVVKLDGSAIRNAQKGTKGRAFLSALTGLCRGLAVETIAEMVDKPEGLTFVRDCGVDYVQGFLFGKPSKNVKDFSPLPQANLFRKRK